MQSDEDWFNDDDLPPLEDDDDDVDAQNDPSDEDDLIDLDEDYDDYDDELGEEEFAWDEIFRVGALGTAVQTISKLDITGPVDATTPTVVLEEIAESHNVSIELLLSGNKPTLTYHEPLDEEEYGPIARFVNAKISWTKNSLRHAFYFIASFKQYPVRALGPFCYGLPTEGEPISFSPCMLYALLKSHVPIPKDVTIEQLATCVSMMGSTIESARNILYNSMIAKANRKELVAMYLKSKPIAGSTTGRKRPREEARPTYDDLITAHETIDDPTIIRRIESVTHAEAIVLAAKIYHLDISSSYSPIQEYERLKNQSTVYIPVDPKLRARVEKDHLSIDIRTNFNPLLPECLYELSWLVRMAVYEGFTHQDFVQTASYSLLQEAYATETFFHGIPELAESTTVTNSLTMVDQIPLTEMSTHEIVCFGTRFGGKAYAFTYGELAAYFKHSLAFKNPLNTKDVFTTRNIRKLKNLCATVYDPATKGNAERMLLLEAMSYVEILANDTTQKIKRFHEAYHEAPSVKKLLSRYVVSKLMDIAMHMRGWRGKGPYPISVAHVAQTEDVSEEMLNQNEVDVLVTESMAEFETRCVELGDIGVQIKALPLIKYISGQYVISNNASEGLTIGERFDIIRKGEGHDTYASCIRLSSNWLAHTAHRLMQLLEMPLPFTAEKLREIS